MCIRDSLRAVPRELFAMEQQHLRPLPAWVPEVYRLHERMVDVAVSYTHLPSKPPM